MWGSIFNGLMPIFKMVGWFLVPVLAAVALLVLMVVVFFIHYRFFLKMPVPVSKHEKFKKPGILKKIFWLFPRQFIDDMFHRDPDEFKEYGLHMMCGEQGSGKTTAVVALLKDLEKRYPKCKVRSNFSYIGEVGAINHWKDLVHNDNGIYGQVEVLDEIQTWFSSLQSKDFPPEMITEISQQRKQRKMIIGTAQVFSRIAKPIREQTTFVYLPMTLAGCFTWVRVSKPRYWDDEKQTFKHYIRHYFFIHTKEVREAFDTYKKVEKYKKDGFKEDKLRLIEN
jgi:hypothetical protein